MISRSGTMLVKTTLAGLLLFAVLACLAGWPAGAQEARPDAGATLDYFSGMAHYAVPARLNPGITRFSEGRNYSALTLMLFLPDFSPVADHPEEMKRPGWHDQMTLLFEHGPRMSEPEAQIASLTNRPLVGPTKPEALSNGCDIYRTPLVDPGDVHACPEDGNKLVVSCTRTIGSVVIPSPACTVMENISSDLGVIYHYSVRYVESAVVIDRHVRSLLSTSSNLSSPRIR